MSSNILLSVLDIYLDTENPRHTPINEQPEIISLLLRGERVRNLARHIASNGMNPLDMVGVVKDEEDNYVVVEGNRRLCALHLLNDPEKAPPGDIQYFKRLSEDSSRIPSSINCVLFDSLDEAYVWMGVRHNGEQDGIGIRNWDSKQRTRHNSRINKKDQNALALSLIEYAITKNILSVDNSEKVITTAARYLGNPFVRETMGIVSARSEQDVKIAATCEEFDTVLAVFCNDLVENTTVNSRSRKDDWVDYAKLLIEKGVVPKVKVDPHLLSECLAPSGVTKSQENSLDETNLTGLGDDIKNGSKDTNENGSESADSHNEIKANGTKDIGNAAISKNPDSRKYIVPHDFKANVNNRILKRVFNEMKSIEIDENPLAVSLITRAFLENLYVLFNEKVTGSHTQQQTHVQMDKAIKEIELDSALSKVERNALGALRRVQSNENNVLSPKTLGANAHAGMYPDPKQLKREFDNIEEIIKYMLKRV